jgi:hypothetical protein
MTMKTKNLLIVGTFTLAVILGVLLATVAIGAMIYYRPDLVTNLIQQVHPVVLQHCKDCLGVCKECLLP